MSADKNMTGEQIQQIMDMLMYKALEPLVLFTNVFDPQVEFLLVLIATNRKRKLSSLEREVVVEKLAAYLSISDKVQRFVYIRDARVQRYFIHRFIRLFLEDNKDYVSQYKDFVVNPTRAKQAALDKRAMLVGRCSRANLYKSVKIAEAYLSQFYVYRDSVIHNYVKNSNKQAKAHLVGTNSGSSYKDLVQSIQKSIITALDKYDSRKGPLTSYINTWVKNATTTTKEHEYGIAYTIPQTQRKKLAEGKSTEVNYGVSLDALYGDDSEDGGGALFDLASPADTVESGIEKVEGVELVQRLAKKVDPLGIARLSLEIGEYFTERERAKMRQHTEEECYDQA